METYFVIRSLLFVVMIGFLPGCNWLFGEMDCFPTTLSLSNRAELAPIDVPPH